MSSADGPRFSDRQRAKELSRAKDEADRRDGKVSREELRATNGIFSSFDIASSSIRRPKQDR